MTASLGSPGAAISVHPANAENAEAPLPSTSLPEDIEVAPVPPLATETGVEILLDATICDISIDLSLSRPQLKDAG